MSITSFTYILFLSAVFIAYYIVPKRFQWVVLLLGSGFFYLSCGVKEAIYVLITATTIYAATIWMEHLATAQKAFIKDHSELTKEEKAEIKSRTKKQRKAVMLLTLLLNLGLLCTFKYIHFFLEQINALSLLVGGAGVEDHIQLIVPLGISFYTFQATGYLLDVYWGYYSPEKNYLKVLLFVSFFPQMTQGPISDFEQLSKELFTEHSYEYKNFSWGAQRMLWGYFKKMAVADVCAPIVQNVFANYHSLSGLATLSGAFLYSLQIYADFSGYMDIMCGFCEMLGIHLAENFDRPYFSKSVTEYWRRWHITLGAWFRKYIYYPIGMSKWSRKLAKASREKYGKHFSDALPATIALIVTWLATGLWHGASWAYIAWGGVNGLFIIASLWLEPVYSNWKHALQIREESFSWRFFQTTRTFILVTIIKVLPEVGTLSAGIGLWRHVITRISFPRTLFEIIPIAGKNEQLAVIVGIFLMLIVSLIQRKESVRAFLEKHFSYAGRMIIYSILLFLMIFWGFPASGSAGGFMYAQF